MTERLYYTDSFLSEFAATVAEVREVAGRTALVLDRSAFYPASGGQVYDTGWIMANGARLRVEEVAEDESGEVLHYIAPGSTPAGPATRVEAVVDYERREDHMQQHSGQHVLSAAFVALFKFPTVSFHMGDETCTIDLEARAVTNDQLREAESLANQIVMEDRPVEIKFATVDQALQMGVRKIPPDVRDRLRLIHITGFDLNACGGTHVTRTGQIGSILLRKAEKVKQGVRVEFVCGRRAVLTARRDFNVLTEAAAIYSAHIWTVPEQIRKSQDEAKAGQKERKRLLEELAELQAEALLREAGIGHPEPSEGPAFRLITRVFLERDLTFVKLLAQKVTAKAQTGRATVVLFGALAGAPALVFAQSAGGPFNMSDLMKETMAGLGARGGGSRDLAQGGVPAGVDLQRVIDEIAARIRVQHRDAAAQPESER